MSRLTREQSAHVRSLMLDSDYTRAEATAWVREMGPEHVRDNQGLCHVCGVRLEPDPCAPYGIPVAAPNTTEQNKSETHRRNTAAMVEMYDAAGDLEPWPTGRTS